MVCVCLVCLSTHVCWLWKDSRLQQLCHVVATLLSIIHDVWLDVYWLDRRRLSSAVSRGLVPGAGQRRWRAVEWHTTDGRHSAVAGASTVSARALCITFWFLTCTFSCVWDLRNDSLITNLQTTEVSARPRDRQFGHQNTVRRRGTLWHIAEAVTVHNICASVSYMYERMFVHDFRNTGSFIMNFLLSTKVKVSFVLCFGYHKF